MLPELKIPDEQTLSRDHPRAQRDSLQANKEVIASDLLAWANEQVGRINSSLQGGNGRPPIHPRTASKPGNISMYDHLTGAKSALESDPEGEASKEVQQLESRIEFIESNAMQKEIVWP